VKEAASIQPQFDRLQNIAVRIGVTALALCALGAGLNPKRFFEAYLMAYVF
jgi:hypothetical protein